jgi:hypothetical protein
MWVPVLFVSHNRLFLNRGDNLNQITETYDFIVAAEVVFDERYISRLRYYTCLMTSADSLVCYCSPLLCVRCVVCG